MFEKVQNNLQQNLEKNVRVPILNFIPSIDSSEIGESSRHMHHLSSRNSKSTPKLSTRREIPNKVEEDSLESLISAQGKTAKKIDRGHKIHPN
jgi:hypothetical protein